MVPTCFGIIISSVDKEHQSASSALGQVFFNLAGFWLAPNVSGYLMDQYANPKEGLIMGYRLILGWNVFTLLFLFAATFFSYLQYRRLYSRADLPRGDSEAKIVYEADDPAAAISGSAGRPHAQSGDIEWRGHARKRINSRENARFAIISAGEIARETRQRMNSVNKIYI